MSQEYGRSSVCVRSWISKLYDFVNSRWQNLQINFFFGRDARPGARIKRRSKPLCNPGGTTFGGNMEAEFDGNVNEAAPPGDGTEVPKNDPFV